MAYDEAGVLQVINAADRQWLRRPQAEETYCNLWHFIQWTFSQQAQSKVGLQTRLPREGSLIHVASFLVSCLASLPPDALGPNARSTKPKQAQDMCVGLQTSPDFTTAIGPCSYMTSTGPYIMTLRSVSVLQTWTLWAHSIATWDTEGSVLCLEVTKDSVSLGCKKSIAKGLTTLSGLKPLGAGFARPSNAAPFFCHGFCGYTTYAGTECRTLHVACLKMWAPPMHVCIWVYMHVRAHAMYAMSSHDT